MRYFTPFCFALIVGLVSCSQGPTVPGDTYDELLFVRQGGGDKVFAVTPIRGSIAVDVSISRFNFRDTVIQFRCDCDPGNANAYLALDNALNGRIPIAGDFHQPTLPTGTWAYLSLVRGVERYEVTNVDLRNQLLVFETIVKNHLQGG